MIQNKAESATTIRGKRLEVEPCLQQWLDHFCATTQRSYVNFVSAFRKFLNERRRDRKFYFSDLDVKTSLEFRDYLIDQQLSESYANAIGVRFRNFYSYAVKQGWTERRKDLFPWVTSAQPKSVAVRVSKSGSVMLPLVRRIAALDLEAVPRLEGCRDLLIFAIITGGATFADLCGLTKNAVSHGRLYWDSVGVSLRTNAQIRYYIDRMPVQGEKLLYCIPEGLTQEEAEGIWHQQLQRLFRLAGDVRIVDRADIAAAICERILRELNYNTHDIAAFLLAPPQGSSLSLKSACTITSEERDAISLRLADEILDIRHHWYAVRLFDKEEMVRRDIEESADLSDHLRLYYPMDEVVSKRGKKIKKVQRPILRRILFVQATSQHIDALQRSRIMQDRLSVVRNRALKNNGYAIIPDAQIEKFSALVSNCTDLIDAEDLGEFVVTTGAYVTITEGRYKGYSGRVFKVRDKKMPMGEDVTMLEIEVEKIGAELAACFGKKLYVTIPQRYVAEGTSDA